ncbi:MAG: M20/M25/M40 family metallo-hydrolase [Clostridiales bacterium]|nr:M20/M25/M40 family metallo-hydrolase [Clostridiales bacterium]
MKDYDFICEKAAQGAEKYFYEQVEYLKTFCGIDCGTWNEKGNAQVVQIIENLLKSMGCDVQRVYEKGLGTHLVGKLTPSSPEGKIVLNAHIDTVFGEGLTAEHPFYIEGDYAYGLGILDCKSGVLIAIYAVKIMLEAGLLPKKEIVFLFNCDEEIGTQSGSKLYAREAKDAQYAFIFESGVENNDGSASFITSRKGVILGTIDVEGKEAHAGAAYLEGRSAILEMAHQIIQIFGFSDMDRQIYYNVAPITGGKPNGIVAGSAHGEFCVAGLPTNASFQEAEDNLKSLEKKIHVNGCKVKVSYRTLFPAMEKNEKNHRAYQLLELPAKLLGMKIKEDTSPAATDAAYFSSLGIPSVDALSAIGGKIHTVEEYLYLPSLKERTKFFAVVLGCMDK